MAALDMQMALFIFLLFAYLPWSNAMVSAKGGHKIVVMMKACVAGDLFDCFSSVAEQVHRQLHTELLQVAINRITEIMRKGFF